MQTYRLTIPARINLLGNPTDGLEGDFATLSATVDLYAGAEIAPAAGLELCARGDGAEACQRCTAADLPLPYTGDLDLVKGALNRLHAFSPEFREKVARQGFRLTTWTDVPRQSGLGGSSLLVLLTLGALRAYYALDPHVHHDYRLAELTQRVEEHELGITCGYADRYVPLFGGLAYLDYHGKLHHAALDAEPYATYERLDPYIPTLPLVAISTGIARDSGNVHGQLRPRYLAEHASWEARGGAPPTLVCFMQGAWETAWRGKQALLRGDLAACGALLNENHRLVDAMMRECGFAAGAGAENNALIEVALTEGAYGAKLTGAGGGGSVFALVPPGSEARLVAAWNIAAARLGLAEAHVCIPRVVPHGLRVEALRSEGV